MLKRLALVLLLLASGSAAVAQANERVTVLIDGAVDGFIRPAYQSMATSAANLNDAVKAMCKAPSQVGLDAARKQFRAATDAWSYAEIIRFGPVNEKNRLERLLFWPDRKSIGLKQVQSLIAKEDSSAADPVQLASKSVAVQGLGALEFVLFGTGSDELAAAETYRCRYGAAVAANIATIADSILLEWNKPGGFAEKWSHPAADNPLYQTGDESVTELLEVFVNGLELVRDVRLRGFLVAAGDDKPKQAIYWRSQGTQRSLAANLAGMKALFAASRLGDGLSPDTHWIADSIMFEFGNAIAAAKAADGPIDAVVADPARRNKLAYFGIVTSSLTDLFEARLAHEFGLTAGFSSLDGD